MRGLRYNLVTEILRLHTPAEVLRQTKPQSSSVSVSLPCHSKLSSFSALTLSLGTRVSLQRFHTLSSTVEEEE